jgi:putative MATE family efflux protein
LSAYTPSQPAGISPPPSGPSPLTTRILKGAPFPQLLRLATPNALAFLVQASVSMAEIAFVARLGTDPLAALALMFPGLMLMQMLANGAIGGAVASAVARALGAGDRQRAEALVWHAVAIALAAGLAFALLYGLAGRALLAWFGASSAVTQAAASYAAIVFGGAAVIWTMALLGAVLRGTGDMRFPALVMVAGAAVQVPLAGTLILGWFGLPPLGLRGAAVAVISVSAVSVVVLLIRLLRGRDVTLTLSALRLQRSLFAAIFRVGALAALSPVFTVLTVMMVNALIGGFGVAALAGYGIVARLEFLLIPLVFGLGAAMTAMVGINVGAGQVARAERIGWLGGLSAAALAGGVGVILALYPGLWIDLFTDDAAIRAAGARYLQIVGPVFAFQGLGLALYFASQGAGTVAWPVLATVLRFVVGVGGAAAGVRWFDAGLVWIYACLAAGMLLYGALTAASLWFGAWRRRDAW